MYHASHVLGLFHLIAKHLNNHKPHILQANWRKLARILGAAQVELTALASTYNETAGKRARDITACLRMLEGAVNRLPKDISSSFRAELASTFQTVGQEADDIVAKNFGYPKEIKLRLQSLLQLKAESLEPKLQKVAEQRVAELQEKAIMALRELDLQFSRHARFEDFSATRGASDSSASFDTIDFGGFNWASWLGDVMKAGVTTLAFTFEVPLIAVGAMVVKGVTGILAYFCRDKAVRRRLQMAAVNSQIAQVRTNIELKLHHMVTQICHGVEQWAECELYRPLVTKQGQIEDLRRRLASGVESLSTIHRKSINESGATTNGI